MSTTYSYQISTHFSNGVNSVKLFKEIIDENIPVELITIVADNDNDNIDLIFNGTLTSGQQTILINLMSVHTIAEIDRIFTKNVDINHETNLMYYYKVKSFFISGKLKEDIKSIIIISNIKNDTDSYDVRVFDTINKTIIAEKNLTNTSLGINDLGAITNVPDNESIFELQVKTNKKGQNIFIDQLIISYVRLT